MVLDMLLNFFIISHQVPSMILMIGIEKVYHCALVGVPLQWVIDGDDDHFYICF